MDTETKSERLIQLGDMTVVGHWPGKMLKALAVIADRLHPAYDEFEGTILGGSKIACLFSSLAVREFLVAIGYDDATVRGCACYMHAIDGSGREIWSVGIGKQDENPIEGKFNGHAVCTVPSLGLLIDTTLYPAIRPQWNGALTGMIALPYWSPTEHKVYDRPLISGLDIQNDDLQFHIGWTDRAELQWRRSTDFRRTARRAAVTQALIDRFGEWHD